VQPFVDEAVGAGAGATAASFYLASQLLDDSSGNAVLGEVTAHAQDLPGELDQRFSNAYNGLERLTDILVSDYGKLGAAYQLANNQLNLSTDQQTTVKNNVITSARQNAYTALMPLAYPAVDVGDKDADKCPVTQNGLVVRYYYQLAINNENPKGLQQFVSGWQPSSYPPFAPVQSLSALLNVRGNYPQPPPSSLTNALFAAPTFATGDINAQFDPLSFWWGLAPPRPCQL
jgi:hypothetical protein